MPGHKDLIGWQRSMDLAVNVYAIGRSLRAARHYDLARQLERAAISIPANVAEGYGRTSRAEFAHFVDISVGSLREVETLVEVGDRIGAIKRESAAGLRIQSDEVGKVLHGLRRYARRPKGGS